jgi:hypothetical protein
MSFMNARPGERLRRPLAAAAAGFVAAGVKGVLPGGTSPVAAYPRLDGGCSVGLGHLSYESQGAWDPDDEDWVDNGFELWDSQDTRAGVRIVSSERDDPNAIPVIRSASTSSNFTTCNGAGVPTSITLGSTGQANLERSAAHEAGHAHGLSHSGHEDNQPFTGASSDPIMDGCFKSDGVVRTDDKAQLSHERDAGALIWSVGFEEPGGWNGSVTRVNGGAFQGSWSASLQSGQAIVSEQTRLTTPSATIRLAARYKSQGGTRIKFEYREVNYGAGTCNAASTFNPDTFNWDDATAAAMWTIAKNEALDPAAAWGDFNEVVVKPGGPSASWTDSDAIDLRVRYWAENAQAAVDNLRSY